MDNASLNSLNVGDFQCDGGAGCRNNQKTYNEEFYMQKKIIALAIASALTAPALAFAEATVYGQANLAVEMMDNGGAPSAKTNQLNSYGSRLGVKGSEALDGGMSVVWMLEGDVGVDTGATTAGQLFNRESNIGLKSDSMGTVTLGRHDTPYKSATRRLDMFGDSAADTRNSLGITMMGGGHDVAASNSITYLSPSMSGLSVAVGSVFGAEKAASTDKKGSAISLAGMYEEGPIYATLAFDKAKAGTVSSGDLGTPAYGTVAADDEAKAFKLGGSYSMDAIAVNAVYEKVTTTLSAVETKGTNLYLAGKFALSSTDAVKLAYTKRGETETGSLKNANDAKVVALGYDHSMSKATSVYALYAKVTQQGTRPDPSTLSVGIKHSF